MLGEILGIHGEEAVGMTLGTLTHLVVEGLTHGVTTRGDGAEAVGVLETDLIQVGTRGEILGAVVSETVSTILGVAGVVVAIPLL